MRFISYTRVSTEDQGNSGLGLEAQQAAIDNFVALGAHELVLRVEEVAGGKGVLAQRPGLQRAFALAKRHGCAVLVSKLDRLSRSVLVIAQLMQEHGSFYTVEDGLACPPVLLQMKAVWAEHERRTIAERTKAALAAKKARGEPLGAQTHKDRAATAAKAAEGRRAYLLAERQAYMAKTLPMLQRMRGQGMQLQAIADELNSTGALLPPRGGKWCASVVCLWLKRGERQQHNMSN